ncbi:BAT1-like protein [Mya arenaria]|uniref:BAT1-like protein n=1 Tax=Mya arenaria TaxID=6604 RepID=A0ABY7EUN3_MYAAR|nr:BAT1-like protein [Mya arenaria]
MADSVDFRKRNTNTNVELEFDIEPRRDVLKLKRNVGLVSGVSFIIGSIIGSGIFISPTGVLSETGSVGLSLVVWAASGAISLLGALSYAELGTMIPRSGGEYAYLYDGMFPFIAYMYSWTRTIVLQPSGVAIICLTFASYMVTFFEYCGSPAPPEKIIACLAIDGTTHLRDGFKGSTNSPSKIALSFYDAMWAYDGWNTLNFLTEEIKNPNRNLPWSNYIGVPLVTIVYILTNISYIVVLSPQGLLDSSADWGKEMLGSAYVIMPIAVMFSTFGAANGLLYSSGRMVYAAAREGHLPEVLSYVHATLYTPLPSIALTGIIAILMTIPADIGSLVDFFSFAAWLFYGLTVACVVILRIRQPNAERPIKVFILFPIVFTLISIYLVIAPIIDDPRLEFLWAAIFIVGGFLFYFPFVVFKIDRGCFDYVTTFLQLVCQIAPSPYIPDI